jgi:hypothetical protein
MTNKQWTLASLGLAVILAALFAFGGHYRAVPVLFLPLGLWLSLRREPEEKQVRPWIAVLGWVFVGFSVVALIAAVVAIAAGKS